MGSEIVSTAAGVAGADVQSWLFESSADPIALLQDGNIELVNPAWANISAWDASDSIGRPFLDIVEEKDAAAVASALTSDAFGPLEVAIRCQRNTPCHVELRGKRISTGRIAVTLRDITEKYLRKGWIAESFVASRTLFSAAGVAYWRFHPAERVFEIDADPHEPFDSRREGAMLVPFEMVQSSMHPDDVERSDQHFYHALATGQLHDLDYRFKQADGAWSHLRSVYHGIVQTQTGEWRLQGVTQNVTELAIARDAALQGQRAAQAAAEAKAEFLANMSHEIRTPMNGLLGMAHLLEATPLREDQKGYVKTLLESGESLLRLLNDVLDLSRLESGKLTINRRDYDLVRFMGSLERLWTPSARTKGLTLAFHLPKTLRPHVNVDALRLKQIASNLIGNAIKFTDDGLITVRLREEELSPSRSRYRIEVTDTGIGIPLDKLARVFDRFVQADNSTTRVHGGSGLGLAISHDLVKLMGGDIGVESTVGRGSTFWFTFEADLVNDAIAPTPSQQAPAQSPSIAPPVVQPSYTSPVSPASASPAPSISASAPTAQEDKPAPIHGLGLRILVAEDNRINQQVITAFLDSIGCHVTMTENGAEAVERLAKGGFDAALIDVRMPVMDGLECMRRVRALPGPESRVPILSVTANAFDTDRRDCLAAGADDYLPKPLSIDALRAALIRLTGIEDETKRDRQSA